MPRQPHTVWSDAAVAGLVGQRPTMHGHPVEVVAARKDPDGDSSFTLDVPDDAFPALRQHLLDGVAPAPHPPGGHP